MRAALLIVMAAFALAACSEREQVVEPQSEKRYQGKADTQPWNNPPLAQEYRGGTWTKGDQKSWDEQIKRRQLAQHEDKRIYQ